jgi:hypothetical protein
MAREYQISKLAGRCSSCNQELAVGSEFVATVHETPQELARQDLCLPCWQARPADAGSSVIAEWRSRVPAKQEKKKLFVDDDVLVQFFKRLADSPEPERVCFRFVLGLVLMRKKVLIYDRLQKLEDGREAWNLHFRQGQEPAVVIDPKMAEESIARVSQQLGEVLEGEL